jgi:hypothetical protein
MDFDFAFDVEASERHHIAVGYNFPWEEIRITIDNKDVIREQHPWSLKRKRRFKFNIGESETHSLELQWRMPWLAQIDRNDYFTAFLDGQQIGVWVCPRR